MDSRYIDLDLSCSFSDAESSASESEASVIILNYKIMLRFKYRTTNPYQLVKSIEPSSIKPPSVMPVLSNVTSNPARTASGGMLIAFPACLHSCKLPVDDIKIVTESEKGTTSHFCYTLLNSKHGRIDSAQSTNFFA